MPQALLMPLHSTQFLRQLMTSTLMDAMDAGLRKEVESLVVGATSLSKVLRVVITQEPQEETYGRLVAEAFATMNGGGSAVPGGGRGVDLENLREELDLCSDSDIAADGGDAAMAKLFEDFRRKAHACLNALLSKTGELVQNYLEGKQVPDAVSTTTQGMVPIINTLAVHLNKAPEHAVVLQS